jgi:hypothetical protein
VVSIRFSFFLAAAKDTFYVLQHAGENEYQRKAFRSHGSICAEPESLEISGLFRETGI